MGSGHMETPINKLLKHYLPAKYIYMRTLKVLFKIEILPFFRQYFLMIFDVTDQGCKDVFLVDGGMFPAKLLPSVRVQWEAVTLGR